MNSKFYAHIREYNVQVLNSQCGSINEWGGYMAMLFTHQFNLDLIHDCI